MTIPSRDSAVGRSVATALQLLAAFGAALPVFAVLLTDPQFNALVLTYFPKLVPVITALALLATLISNLIRKEVPNV